MIISPAVLAGSGASIIMPVLEKILPGDDPEEDFYTWAEDTFGSDRFFRHGVFGVAGVNLKGSLQMNNPFPTRMAEIAGAPGAVFVDLYKGIEELYQGNILKGVEKVLPAGFGNISKAFREGTEGVTTGSYSPVFYGDEPLKATPLDLVLRMGSFNPARLSSIREEQWKERRITQIFAERRRKIYGKYKKLVLFGKGDIAKIMKEVARYNELVHGTGRNDIPMLTRKSLNSVIRRARKPSKI